MPRTDAVMRCRSKAAIVLVVVVTLLAACSSTPPSDEFSQVIRQHFESRGYRVVELVLRDVQPLAMGEKRYMGTEGYTVRVARIVLDAPGRAGLPDSTKGTGQMTFSNATVSVRENPGQKGTWLVTSIQGIAIP